MRALLLAEHLRQEPAGTTVAALAELMVRAVQQGNEDAVMALSSLASALGNGDMVPYDVRRALYTEAKRLEHPEVARLFFDISPQVEAPVRGDDPMAPERTIVPRGRPLTLGERKSLARSHRRELLLHLLRDPHPDVVTVLLGNPHLTERDVVTLAARRPALPESLAAVAASDRWSARYEVKRALVKNPYTPVLVAMRLATTLRPSDLRAIASDTNLAAPLRDQARALIALLASRVDRVARAGSKPPGDEP